MNAPRDPHSLSRTRRPLLGALPVLLALPGCLLPTPRGPGAGPGPKSPEPPPATTPIRRWAVPDAAEVDADGVEPPDNAVWSGRRQAVVLSGAPGEAVGFQLVIAGEPAPRPGVTVRFAPAVGSGKIPETAFRAFRADWVRVRRFRPWYSAETGRPPARRLFADPLTPLDGAFTVPAGRPQPIFVDLEIPASAVPGDYLGRIEISAPGVPPVRTAIEIEVWPFELAGGRTALPAVSRLSAARLLSWEADRAGSEPPTADALMSDDPAAARGRAALGRALALLREHGVRPMIDDVRPAVEFHWPGRATVNWAAYDAFLDRFAPSDPTRPREPLPAPLSAEFPDPAAFATAAPDEPPIPGADKPTYVYYERALRDYARQIAARLAERGRLGSAVVLYEPPEQSGPEIQLARAARFAAVLGELRPNLPVVVPFSARWVRAHGGQRAERSLELLTAAVGAWRPTAHWFEPPAEPADGKPAHTPVWLAPSEPPLWPAGRIESPRAGVVGWGWAARRYRPDVLDIGPACSRRVADAAARSAWAAGAAEPPAADTLAVDADDASPWLYPGGPRPSIRLKLVRRALQDYRYQQLLERAVGPQRAALPGRALVRFALHEGAGRGPAEGRFDGWSRSADDYEQVRREAARAIAAWVHKGRPSPEQIAAPESWERLLARSERVELEVLSTRVVPPAERPAGGAAALSRLDVRVRAVNLGARPRDDAGWVALQGLGPQWRTAERTDLPKLPAGGSAEVVLTAVAEGASTAEPGVDGVLVWRRAAGERAVPLRPRRQIARAVLAPPTIDGRLGDWTNRPDAAADRFTCLHAFRTRDDVLEPIESARRTGVHAVHDEQFLYFAFDCPRPAGEPLRVDPGNRAARWGGALWGEDAVELTLIAPGEPESARLYRITVKANGSVETAVGPDGRLPTDPWPVQVPAACSVDDNAWRCELRVPWSALGGRPRAGVAWGVNYSRHCAAGGETSAWSAAVGHIFRAEAAGLLILR